MHKHCRFLTILNFLSRVVQLKHRFALSLLKICIFLSL